MNGNHRPFFQWPFFQWPPFQRPHFHQTLSISAVPLHPCLLRWWMVGLFTLGLGYAGQGLTLPDVALGKAASSVETKGTEVDGAKVGGTQINGTRIAEVMNRPTLKAGSQGAEVSELQATLKLLGFYNGSVDGVYGQTTATAVSRFQQAAGLPADGIAGPATWNRLFPAIPGVAAAPTPTPVASRPTPVKPSGTAAPKPAAVKPQATRPVPAPTAAKKPESATNAPSTELVSFPVLKLGMKGPAVTGLQYRLRAIGFLKGGVDGAFGPDTQESVKAAQRKFKLEADGVVGPATWLELMR